jgi:hypothetical protein
MNDGRELPAWDVWKASDRWALFVAFEVATRHHQIETHQRQTEVRTVDNTAAAVEKVRDAGIDYANAYAVQARAEMYQTRVGYEKTIGYVNAAMSQTAAEKAAKQHPDYIAAKDAIIVATQDKIVAFTNWACALIEAGAAHLVPMMPTAGDDR